MDALRRDILQWETDFVEETGRRPTRDDVKRVGRVAAMYKRYSAMKKLHAKGNGSESGGHAPSARRAADAETRKATAKAQSSDSRQPARSSLPRALAPPRRKLTYQPAASNNFRSQVAENLSQREEGAERADATLLSKMRSAKRSLGPKWSSMTRQRSSVQRGPATTPGGALPTRHASHQAAAAEALAPKPSLAATSASTTDVKEPKGAGDGAATRTVIEETPPPSPKAKAADEGGPSPKRRRRAAATGPVEPNFTGNFVRMNLKRKGWKGRKRPSQRRGRDGSGRGEDGPRMALEDAVVARMGLPISGSGGSGGGGAARTGGSLLTMEEEEEEVVSRHVGRALRRSSRGPDLMATWAAALEADEGEEEEEKEEGEEEESATAATAVPSPEGDDSLETAEEGSGKGGGDATKQQQQEQQLPRLLPQRQRRPRKRATAASAGGTGGAGGAGGAAEGAGPTCPGHGMPAKRLRVKKVGANKGRYFFACPLPRSQQCAFFQWEDEDPRAAMALLRGGGASAKSAESGGPTYSRRHWTGLTVPELRRELRIRCQPSTGNKPALVARLRECDGAEGTVLRHVLAVAEGGVSLRNAAAELQRLGGGVHLDGVLAEQGEKEEEEEEEEGGGGKDEDEETDEEVGKEEAKGLCNLGGESEDDDGESGESEEEEGEEVVVPARKQGRKRPRRRCVESDEEQEEQEEQEAETNEQKRTAMEEEEGATADAETGSAEVSTTSPSAWSIMASHAGWSPGDDERGMGATQRRLLRASLALAFGHRRFRPGQLWAVKRSLQGKRSLLVLATGCGKSLCYQLPALLGPPQSLTLVVSPLVSLMADQHFRLPRCIPGACLSQQQSGKQQAEILRDARAGRLRVLLLSPERLFSASFYRLLTMPGALPPIEQLVIDEAHCLSEWSHNFRPAYLRVRALLRGPLRPRSVLALTATATAATTESVCRALGISEQAGVWRGEWRRPNLSLRVNAAPHRHRALMALLQDDFHAKAEGIIVYVQFQRDAEALASFLSDQGHSCRPYHGGMPRAKREDTQSLFMRGRVRVVVATVAFGMGLDKANVRAVIHFHLPKSLEHYVQEVGRAGRDGAPARCTAFYDASDVPRAHSMACSGLASRAQVRSALALLFPPALVATAQASRAATDATAAFAADAAGIAAEAADEGGAGACGFGCASGASGSEEEPLCAAPLSRPVPLALPVQECELALDLQSSTLETLLAVTEAMPAAVGTGSRAPLLSLEAAACVGVTITLREQRGAAIQALAKQEPVVEVAMRCGRTAVEQAGNTLAAQCVRRVALSTLAAATGWDPARVHAELHRLRRRGALDFALHQFSHRVRLLAVPLSLEALATRVHGTLARVAQEQEGKVARVAAAFAAVASEPEEEKREPALLRAIDDYFHPTAAAAAAAAATQDSSGVVTDPRECLPGVRTVQHKSSRAFVAGEVSAACAEARRRAPACGVAALHAALRAGPERAALLPQGTLRRAGAMPAEAEALALAAVLEERAGKEATAAAWPLLAGGGTAAEGAEEGDAADPAAHRLQAASDAAVLALLTRWAPCSAAVARILHGASSPRHTSLMWRKSRFWGLLREFAFPEVVRAAAQALGEEKEEGTE